MTLEKLGDVLVLGVLVLTLLLGFTAVGAIAWEILFK